jgi:hypothetical protein
MEKLTSDDDLVKTHGLVVLVVVLVEPELAVIHGVLGWWPTHVQLYGRVVEHGYEFRLDLTVALEEYEVRRILARERGLDERLVEDAENAQRAAVL